MSQKTIPDSHANRLNFFKNFKKEFNDNAAAMKYDATFIAGINAMLDKLIAVYQTLVDAEAAVTAASYEAAQQFGVHVGALHGLIDNLKANPNCTPTMLVAMAIEPRSSQRDATAIKPKIKLESQPGHVRVTGSKDYAELINIYMRLVGTTKWTLVGIRRKRFPFDDQTPLATPGVAETREYMAVGVNGDDEVGQPSDIVTVTFAG